MKLWSPFMALASKTLFKKSPNDMRHNLTAVSLCWVKIESTSTLRWNVLYWKIMTKNNKMIGWGGGLTRSYSNSTKTTYSLADPLNLQNYNILKNINNTLNIKDETWKIKKATTFELPVVNWQLHCAIGVVPNT